MAEYIETFARVEHKYILPKRNYEAFLEEIAPYIEEDEYPRYSLRNIYYDAPDNRMIMRSLEGPVYKEKLRLRAYGERQDDMAFIEIKKKFDGIVYKRRIALHEPEAMRFLEEHHALPVNSQIGQEITYIQQLYNVRKKMFISYDRIAFRGKNESDVRITFDTNIAYRLHNLSLEKTGEEIAIREDDAILLEIKVMDRYPIWLSNALAKMKLYKNSFSKYGIIYSALTKKERQEKNIVMSYNQNQEVLSCLHQF